MSDIIVPHPNTRILRGRGKLCKKQKPYKCVSDSDLPSEAFGEIPIKREFKNKFEECGKSVNYKFPDRFPENFENNFSKIKSIQKLESYKGAVVSVKPVKPVKAVKLDCNLAKIDHSFDWPDPEPTKWRWDSEYCHSE